MIFTDENKTVSFQVMKTVKNPIGENIQVWETVATVQGILDLIRGNTRYSHNARHRDSTHLLLCDYAELAGSDLTSGNCRVVCDGEVYSVLMIDDPMLMHNFLEIYLKYVGVESPH